MDYYTLQNMTDILNDAGCGYSKRTITYWIDAFNTEKHIEEYGAPRKSEHGNQNKKPIEYPEFWFGAVIDEHFTDIHDRIYEYQAAKNDGRVDQEDMNDFEIIKEQYSLNGHEFMQMEAEQLFKNEDRYHELLKEIVVKALNINTGALYEDIMADEVSDNLLDYVDRPD